MKIDLKEITIRPRAGVIGPGDKAATIPGQPHRRPHLQEPDQVAKPDVENAVHQRADQHDIARHYDERHTIGGHSRVPKKAIPPGI